ncbi:alpha/beta hydrolase [Saccharopolyspora sp. CA-218241]|uniref:alpha/beta hydrolase n=1 Tax=Saccharopolyspora sp. CA-218241 TaxID=3240027 RepID=UPI003D95F996
MVSLSEVRRWQPGALDQVHRSLGARQQELVGLDDELAGARNPDGWSGEAATASAERHRALVDGMRRIVAEITGVRGAVARASDEVEAIKRKLAEADELAGGSGFAITEDGGVKDVAPPENVPADELESVKAERRQTRDRISQLVGEVLDDAEDTDAALAKALVAAEQDKSDPGQGSTLASAASAEVQRPEDGGPEENAEWWRSLSDAQRAALLADPPAWLGGMDGIPAEVRDTANRARIDDERTALEQEKAELARGGITGDEQDAIDRIDAKLDSIDAVEETIAREDPPRQLLVLDTGGERVKAAVAVGDVDTAEHVSVFTPGFTTTVDGTLKGMDAEMAALVAESEEELSRSGGKGEVAAVSWIGYEAPQRDMSMLDPDESVASADPAKEGGAALNSFYQGINASREDDPHLTAIGHSYGSTTTGYALQGGGHGVDDVVLYGSPGMGTEEVSDLGVPEGNAYLLEAKNDPVADFSRFGGDPSHMDGFTQLSTEKSEHGSAVTGHSDYLDGDTTSQHNVATVVAGVPEQAVTGDSDGAGDVISWLPHQGQQAADAIQEFFS